MNPIVLSSRVTMADTGAIAVFDSSALANLTRTPMEIRELLFTGVTAAGGVHTPACLTLLSGKVGRYSLTSGPTPMAVFGPSRSWELEESTANLPATPLGIPVASAVRWKFHRPLILRPGAGFAFDARCAQPDKVLLGGSPGNTTVTVSAIGRYLPAGATIPDVQEVPYVTSARILVNNVANSGGDKPFLSQQDELTNDNDKPMTARRIVGVRFFLGSTSAKTPLAFTQDSSTSPDNLVSELVNIQFPDRTKLSSGQIPFDGVFAQRFALEGEFVVPVGGRCVVEVFSKQRDFTGSEYGYEVLKFGIVGDRLEVV